MHIRRKPSQILVWDNVIYRGQNSAVERSEKEKDESTSKARTIQAGKLWKEDTWKRIRKSFTKAFSCKPKRGFKNVSYASLTHLDQLRVYEDELTKSQKKLRFCSKRMEQERNTFDYEQCEESEEEDIDDSVFVQRSESFERRRMAICKEIERNIQHVLFVRLKTDWIEKQEDGNTETAEPAPQTFTEKQEGISEGDVIVSDS